MVDVCYPEGTDWSCALTPEEVAALDPDRKERAEALAWSTLSSLLGYRLALCPTVLRPCAKACVPGTWFIAPVAGGFGSAFSPYLSDGRWFNGCGCTSDCSCGTLNQVIMPTPVGGIFEVRLNGAVLDPTAYRVDNGNSLVRTDGGSWPTCQNMGASLDDEGTFGVSYYPFLAPNDLLRFAAGVLANEYYKSCGGQKCRLPNGVTNITRNGISMELPTGLFPNGGTGLPEVDPIIRIYNPNGLKMPPRAMSPDYGRGRVQTG